MRLAILLAAAIALVAAPAALAKPAARAPKPAAPAAAPAGPGTAGPADPPATAAAPPGDPTLADMRCIVVAGALLGSDDEQMKSLGRANLFYYLGRIQGRGDTANMDARIVAEYARMTEDEVKAEARSCGATFTGAAQALQELSDALEKHFGGPGGGPAGARGAAPK